MMRKFLISNVWILLVLILIGILFRDFLLHGLLPIPADTIIGLYHPYRDLYAADFPRGIPFKNFLITDPVRQIIPWKMLVIDSFRQGILPLWNPYEMSGKPLLANFQSGVWYPLNIFLFIKPFYLGWTFYIGIQQILAAVFFYVFVLNMGVQRRAAAFGALAFTFSGFMIAWLEWGNIGHTIVWLPLILLSVDKLLISTRDTRIKVKHSEFLWSIVFVLAMVSSLFAGHLQTHIYIVIFTLMYIITKAILYKKYSYLLLFLLLLGIYAMITAIQWLPTLQYILLSARGTDQVFTTQEGWFIPFRHLVQFVAPDFFGNPTTLNYWGTWNYGELVGYIGLVPLLFAMVAIVARRDKKTLVYATTIFVLLLFSLPTLFAKLPFQFSIPFISSAQPTRMLSIITFALAVLSTLGFDTFLMRIEDKKNKVFTPLYIVFGLFVGVFAVIWLSVLMSASWLDVTSQTDLAVAKRNLIIPSCLFGLAVFGTVFITVFRNRSIQYLVILALFGITFFDLLRFGDKFLPFTPKEYLFPNTQILTQIQSDSTSYRLASLNSEILPPNFATAYAIESIEGYDPLYLRSYAQFISTLERGNATNHELLSFNRILTPHNTESPLFDFLNTKYIVSFSELRDSKYRLIGTEGQTRLYENTLYYPRVYFVSRLIGSTDKSSQLTMLYEENLRTTAIIDRDVARQYTATGSASVVKYSPNEVIIETNNSQDGFLVFSDTFYPTWTATIDGKYAAIHQTNIAFRGLEVPKGKHIVLFKNQLFKIK